MYIDPATWVPALSASYSLWNPGDRPTNIPDGSDAVSGPWQVISNGQDITHLLNGTANPDFPPKSWLGFGLDMTTVTPGTLFPKRPLFPEESGRQAQRQRRVINLQAGGVKKELGDTSWLVPNGVDATADATGGKGEDISYTSGDNAASAFSIDSDLAIRYMAINGGASANYAIKKTFQRNFQYSLTAYNDVQILVSFIEYANAINVPLLRRFLDRIPRFNPDNNETVYADNSNSTVNQEFNADVNAEFKGLKYGGKWDLKLNNTSQFQTYEQTAAKKCSCLGGDVSLAATIDSNPSAEDVYQTYTKWVKSAGTKPNVMSFKTQPLWELLFEANDTELNRREADVRKAYSWIVENPKVHLTGVRLTITSDWGEFALQTPGAFIVRNTSAPEVEGAFFSQTKVTWTSPDGLKRALAIELVPRPRPDRFWK
ncbi:MAG: hypothetical protein Q9166_001115 [cf. Caloplaca sp. 2 TL-2023]